MLLPLQAEMLQTGAGGAGCVSPRGARYRVDDGSLIVLIRSDFRTVAKSELTELFGTFISLLEMLLPSLAIRDGCAALSGTVDSRAGNAVNTGRRGRWIGGALHCFTLRPSSTKIGARRGRAALRFFGRRASGWTADERDRSPITRGCCTGTHQVHLMEDSDLSVGVGRGRSPSVTEMKKH